MLCISNILQYRPINAGIAQDIRFRRYVYCISGRYIYIYITRKVYICIYLHLPRYLPKEKYQLCISQSVTDSK